MAKFVCSICRYKHDGDEAPAKCPVCLSPSSQFTLLDDSEQEETNVVVSNHENSDSHIPETDSSIPEHIEPQSTSVEKTSQTDNSVEDIEKEHEVNKLYVSKEDEGQILEFGEAKLQAVKWYKEKYNCGLKEAKDVVESVLEKHGVLSNEKNEVESDFYTENKNYEDVPKQSNKKSCLTIIGIIALVLFVGGLLFNKSPETEQDPNIAVNDSIVAVDTVAEEDIRSKEYVTKYLEETLNQAIRGTTEQAVAKYFTKDFVNLYREVEDYDNKTLEPGTLGFWDFDFWTGGQDGELQNVKVVEVKEMTRNSAAAIVQYLIKSGDYDESKVSNQFHLLLENDEWRIDDFNNYKWRFKNYLEESAKQQVVEADTAVADTIAVVE